MIAPPCVPRPASSPPPDEWRAFVCRPSGRLTSAKHTSATAAQGIYCKFQQFATIAVVSVLRFAADADLLWPMAALLFAIGQVFTVASRSWLFHFVAPSSPALIALFGGWHRFSPASPAGIHTPLRSDSLLPSTLPITHARGTKKRRRYLSEPFPPTPSRHYKRERAQVACAGVTANRRHPAAARCAHDSLCLSRFSNHRIRMERRHRRFLQHSVGVNRPGAFCPGSDHASILPIVCCCRGSSHRLHPSSAALRTRICYARCLR